MAQSTGALAPAQGCLSQKFSTFRRRLADNVICLFSQDREPIARQRWRGLRSGNVVKISIRPRLMPGDFAQIWGDPTWSNHGKLVRLKSQVRRSDMPPGVWWEVEAVCDQLTLVDVDTGEKTGHRGRRGVSLEKHLRRVSNLLS